VVVVPEQPKIFHIVHCDRLSSIINDGHLFADAEIAKCGRAGTNIGMNRIKQRRLETPIKCRPGLNVGGCVPFYFCPRSIMLYLLHKGNDPDLTYLGGQGPIVHLVGRLHKSVEYAKRENLRWAFTTSNASSKYFRDYCALDQLGEVNWSSMPQKIWTDPQVSEGRQAEFLIEARFPWTLVEYIGVSSAEVMTQVNAALSKSQHKPQVGIQEPWYY
jgi:hypothetical protein